jgi:hypothetical protein
MAKGEAGRQERESSNNPAETQRWQRAPERSAPPELYNRCIHHVGERILRRAACLILEPEHA